MARQRNYRAEYQARKARAREAGFTGYGQQRYQQDRELKQIMTSDPVFTALPDAYQTRENAKLYRQGFRYVGKPTKLQKAARDELLRVTGDTLDTGTWAQYYKNVIYPQKTGHAYPDFQVIQPVDWEHMTPELFDRLTGE